MALMFVINMLGALLLLPSLAALLLGDRPAAGKKG